MHIHFNIPIALTLARIVMIPVFMVIYYLPTEWARLGAALVFALAAVTDWLDGYLARLWQQESAFGAFLDPVADKLMVAVALVLIVQSEPTPWLAVPAAIIIGREITISALREWMAELGKRANVAVSVIGKIKTSAQMAAILLLVYRDPIGPVHIYEAGFTLLYVAAILTLWSMAIYLKAAWKTLRKA
ncbi:MAG: CDP-diacylglycerol--glycerol-3-phosphate 3-phosphatidyltransferase [Gammaproteobacteria bacterium]